MNELQDEEFDPLLDQHGSCSSSDEESVKSSEPPFEYESVSALRAMTSEEAWQYHASIITYWCILKYVLLASGIRGVSVIDKSVSLYSRISLRVS